MSAEDILASLQARGLDVSASGPDLRVRGPAGALTTELKQLLTDHKQALIEHLGNGATAGIPRSWSGEDTDLSFMQERMWYFSKAGLAPAYNVVAAYHLKGRLDHRAMRASINDLVARHATLRSYVVEDGGRPRLRYARGVEIELPVEDLSGISCAERLSACHDRIREEYFHDFDVQTPPLLYFKVFQLSEDETVLYCNLHHMLTDAFSFSVIVRELAEGYAARAEGREPSFPPLPIQFPDWIRWQRTQYSGERLTEDLAYWKERLSKPLPQFELTPDYPRKSAFDLSGSDFAFEIPPAKRDRLAEVGRTVGATPFMVLMAGLKLAIHYLTSATDIIVGTPVAGRAHPELRNLIGGFLNTIPVRTTVDPNESLRHYLRTVKNALLGALAHQDAPFNDVVRSLGLPHDPSRTPVYQVSLNLWDISDRPVIWGNLEATRFHVSTPWTHAEFAMWLMNSEEEGIQGTCTYSTELFDRASGLRLGHAVHQVLDLFLEDLDRTIADASLVTDEERVEWLEWNTTGREAGEHALVHELLLEGAGKTPDRDAIRDATHTLTYGDLESESARIAGALRAAGVAEGDLVAVLLTREARILPLLIGILRSGAGYVPLDPEYPLDRIQFIVGDSEAVAIVCADDTAHLVPDGSTILNLDDHAFEENPDFRSEVQLEPESTAYVIYTSGSTGRPKGVKVSHANVVNFLSSMADKPGLQESDVLLAATTVSFDISVLELFLPLVVGARVVLASQDELDYPDEFIQSLEVWRPTVVQATPSFWRMLFEAGWQGDASLKVLVGGEALPMDLAAQLVESVGELWNMYGPTETTIWSTIHQVVPSDLELPSIPIGKPIANTQVLIVDGELHPVPIGVKGELLIGGGGVSLGYHRRPDLTAQRFVELDGYGRMYRTGDRARYRHTGELEFFGRLDWQLKVRGHRIEPGEVEQTLRAHRSVKEAVVDGVDFADGDMRLVAWVVFDTPGGATPSELRAHLRATLPDYMVPGLFLEIPEIPRTPSGKVDRAALPSPKIIPRQTEDFRPPRPGAEELVAGTWKGLLQLDAVGRDDNFFELGGHSLLSVRVIAELERETGQRLDPRLLFFYSLEQVAAALEAATASA